MQRGQRVVAAGVAGDQVQAGDRHIQLGVLGVHQGEELGSLTVDLQGDQAQVATDAVVDMHHGRTFAQFGEVLDHVVAGVARFLAASTLHHPLAEQRALGDQGQVVEQQAVVERGDADAQALLAGGEFRPTGHFPGFELEAGEQLQQHFAAPGGLGAEQHAARILFDETAQSGQGLAGLGLDRQVGQGLGVEALAADARFDIFLADDDSWPVFQAGEAVFHRQEDVGRRQQWALEVAPAFFIAIARVVPEVLGGLFHARQGKYLGVLWQVVEQGRGFFEEQRQVILDTGRGDAGGQVLVDRAAAEVDVEALAETSAKVRDRLLLQRKLAGRQQLDRGHLVDRALGFRIEGAQGFDLVVEQVDAKRLLAAHREQVDQGAAHGELAVLVDRVDAAVTRRFQAAAHVVDVELLAGIQHQAATEQEALGGQAMQGGGDRYDQDAVFQLRQAIERGNPLRDDVLVR
ncbi:hypothetical protein D3C85_444920 [compost metagenome]